MKNRDKKYTKKIGAQGAEALPESGNGNTPERIAVTLGKIDELLDIYHKSPKGNNKIDSAGAKALTKALSVKESRPIGETNTLFGSHNNEVTKIDDEGAKALAKALKSGACPPKLTLCYLDPFDMKLLNAGGQDTKLASSPAGAGVFHDPQHKNTHKSTNRNTGDQDQHQSTPGK